MHVFDNNYQVLHSQCLVDIVRHVVDTPYAQPNILQKLLTILQHVPTLLSHKRDTLATCRNVLHALAHDIAAV